MNPEWLGIPAAVLVFLSYIFSNQTKLRIVNMVACVFFVAYGLAIAATTGWTTGWATVILNFASFIVHIVWLIKHRKSGNTDNSQRDPEILGETSENTDDNQLPISK